MPCYEYRCPSCGDFEIFQPFFSPSLTNCENCGKIVERLISSTEVQIKEIKTVGQWAEQNSKKMGNDKLREESAKIKRRADTGLAKLKEEEVRKYIDSGKVITPKRTSNR